MTEKQETKCEPVILWVTLVGNVFAHLLMDGYVRNYGLLYLELLDIFDEGPQNTGLVATMFAIFVTCSAPVWGILNDRLGPWKMMICGAILAAIGNILCAYSPSILLVYVGYGVIFGLGENGAYLANITSVTHQFIYHRSIALGIIFAGGSLGSILFPFLFQAIVPVYTVRGYFLICAGFFLNLLAVALLVRTASKSRIHDEVEGKIETDKKIKDNTGCSESPTIVKTISGTLDEETKSGMSHVSSTAHINLAFIEDQCNGTVQEIRPNTNEIKPNQSAANNNVNIWVKFKQFWKPFVTLKVFSMLFWYLCYIYAAFGYIMYFPAYARDLGMTDLQITTLLSVFGATELVSRVGTGFIVAHRKVNIYFFISVNMLSVGIFTVFMPTLLTMGPTFAILMGHMVVYTLLSGGLNSLVGSIAMQAVSVEAVGTLIGIASVCFGIGLALPPVIYGALKESTDSYIMVPYLSGASAILCAVVIQIGQVPGYYDRVCCRLRKTVCIS